MVPIGWGAPGVSRQCLHIPVCRRGRRWTRRRLHRSRRGFLSARRNPIAQQRTLFIAHAVRIARRQLPPLRSAELRSADKEDRALLRSLPTGRLGLPCPSQASSQRHPPRWAAHWRLLKQQRTKARRTRRAGHLTSSLGRGDWEATHREELNDRADVAHAGRRRHLGGGGLPRDDGQMLSRRYGHHHPAHLERAKNSLSAAARHTRRHTLPSTEREQSASNVRNIAVVSRAGK
jgi:hypothetical protein